MHDLQRAVGDLPQAQRQRRVDGVAQRLDVVLQRAGRAAAQRVDPAVLPADGQRVERSCRVGGVQVVPLLDARGQSGLLAVQQLTDGAADHRGRTVVRAVDTQNARPDVGVKVFLSTWHNLCQHTTPFQFFNKIFCHRM